MNRKWKLLLIGENFEFEIGGEWFDANYCYCWNLIVFLILMLYFLTIGENCDFLLEPPSSRLTNTEFLPFRTEACTFLRHTTTQNWHIPCFHSKRLRGRLKDSETIPKSDIRSGVRLRLSYGQKTLLIPHQTSEKFGGVRVSRRDAVPLVVVARTPAVAVWNTENTVIRQPTESVTRRSYHVRCSTALTVYEFGRHSGRSAGFVAARRDASGSKDQSVSGAKFECATGSTGRFRRRGGPTPFNVRVAGCL